MAIEKVVFAANSDGALLITTQATYDFSTHEPTNHEKAYSRLFL